MIFQEELLLLWICWQLFLVFHQFRRWKQFQICRKGIPVDGRTLANLFNGITSLINLYLYSPHSVGYPLYGLWILISVRRFFAQRTDMGKEFLWTLVNVVGHSAGFFLAAQSIASGSYKVAIALLSSLFFVLHRSSVQSSAPMRQMR